MTSTMPKDVTARPVVWLHGIKVNGEPYPVRTGPVSMGNVGDLFAPAEFRTAAAAHELGHLLVARHYGVRMDSLTLGARRDGSQHAGSGNFLASYGNDTAPRDRDLATMPPAGERAADRWMRDTGLWTPERAVLVECMAIDDRADARNHLPALSFDGGPDDYGHLHEAADAILDLYWDRLHAALEHIVTRDRWTGDEIADLAGLTNPTID